MADPLAQIDVEKDVRAIIAEILELDDPNQIDGSASFTKDMGMDSMMALELLASIEKKYRIIIAEDNLPKFTTLNQTVAIVKDIIKRQKQ